VGPLIINTGSNLDIVISGSSNNTNLLFGKTPGNYLISLVGTTSGPLGRAPTSPGNIGVGSIGSAFNGLDVFPTPTLIDGVIDNNNTGDPITNSVMTDSGGGFHETVQFIGLFNYEPGTTAADNTIQLTYIASDVSTNFQWTWVITTVSPFLTSKLALFSRKTNLAKAIGSVVDDNEELRRQLVQLTNVLVNNKLISKDSVSHVSHSKYQPKSYNIKKLKPIEEEFKEEEKSSEPLYVDSGSSTPVLIPKVISIGQVVPKNSKYF